MKPNLLKLSPLVLGLLGAGCTMSRVDTSTGLPYWPPAELRPMISAAPAARPPTAPADTAARPVPQASAWRSAATRWLGVPYRLGGHDRSGVDCSGFSDILHREVAGRRLARTAADQWLEGQSIDLQHAQPGDLVFFQTTGERISHVGVSMGGNEFAHASTSKGVMFSSLTEPYWSQRRLDKIHILFLSKFFF